MRKLIVGSSAAALVALFTGCAGVAPSAQSGRLTGLVYSDYSGPHSVTANSGSSKSGSASATSILGIVASGDASVQAAAASAGITKIQHVDQKMERILMFWARYTVTVYGE